jgi:hypothetical protein
MTISNWSDGKDVAALECSVLLFPMAKCFYEVVVKIVNGYESFSNNTLIVHIDHQQRDFIFFRIEQQPFHRTTPNRTFVLIIYRTLVLIQGEK